MKQDYLTKSEDLSHIDTLDDLHKEIALVKSRIKTGELIIKENLRTLPKDAARFAVQKAVPSFMRKWKMFSKLYK